MRPFSYTRRTDQDDTRSLAQAHVMQKGSGERGTLIPAKSGVAGSTGANRSRRSTEARGRGFDRGECENQHKLRKVHPEKGKEMTTTVRPAKDEGNRAGGAMEERPSLISSPSQDRQNGGLDGVPAKRDPNAGKATDARSARSSQRTCSGLCPPKLSPGLAGLQGFDRQTQQNSGTIC